MYCRKGKYHFGIGKYAEKMYYQKPMLSFLSS
jgi:hypothetical protein